MATKELVSLYKFEQKRLDREDAETTQKIIRKELTRRFVRAMEMLDEDENGVDEIVSVINHG